MWEVFKRILLCYLTYLSLNLDKIPTVEAVVTRNSVTKEAINVSIFHLL